MSLEVTRTFEIDGRHYVIPEVGNDLDKMSPRQIIDNSIANFATEDKATRWARERSDSYKPPVKKKTKKARKTGLLQEQGYY